MNGIGTVVASTNSPFSFNQFYDFKITDDGTNMLFYFGNLQTPILHVTDTTTFGRYVGFYNREGTGGGSSISAGSEVQIDFLRINSPITAANYPGEVNVVAWGRNDFGQANVPTNLTDAVDVSGGARHSIALRSDGTVVAWGLNDLGETDVPAGLNNVIAISAGGWHNLALKSGRTVVAWGYNTSGQSTAPVGLSDVVAVAAGNQHSLTLKSDGTVVAWGYNAEGQTNVPTGLTNVIAISAQTQSLALRSDGTVVAWGNNTSGQASVPTGLSSVVAISAGINFSLALKSNGTVVAWGNNDYGQINVPAGLSSVTAIEANAFSSMALKSDGTLVVWGRNDFGQLSVPTNLLPVVRLAHGQGDHDLVLVNNSRLKIYTAVELEAFFESGKNYQLQTSADLMNWTDLGNPIAGTGSYFTNLYSTRGSSNKYYRFLIVP